MLPVGRVRRHGQLHVAAALDSPGAKGAVGQRDPADLHVVFRGDDDLGLHVDPLVDALEHGTVQRKGGRIGFYGAATGLKRRGPCFSRLAFVQVNQVPHESRV